MSLQAVVICFVFVVGTATVTADDCPRFPPNRYPVCTPRYINLTIFEELQKGTDIVQINCTDPDNTGGGNLKWDIDEGNVKGVFTVSKTGMLMTKKIPDAEGRVNPYSLYITASDAGDPSLSSLVVVNLIIASLNDEPPKINGLPAVVNVPEDSPVGTIVTSCTLDDADTSRLLHGLARIEIISGNEDSMYRLDSITCALALNQRLDYETMGPRTLLLRARDLDIAAPLTTEQNITIKILDANDHPPTCSDYVIYLTMSEDLAVGHIMTSLNCSDVDVTDQLQYAVAKGSPKYLAVDASTGFVRLDRSVDFETVTYFDVTFHVYDLSAVPFTTTVIVTVQVIDVDDNIPQFQKSFVKYAVAEHADIGYVIGTLSTTDADLADTSLSTVTYTLQSSTPSLNWFSVDPTTGVVFIKRLLDYEVAGLVSLVVSAHSSNKTAATSTATINITIMDINDNAPVFNQTLYEGHVTANSASGTSVSQVFASDADTGPSATIVFSINSTLFKIQKTSGLVLLTGSVDYETMTSHLLVVTATDAGTPALTSHALLKVRVDAQNEEAPLWIIPAGNQEIRTVAENTAPGTLLFSVSASDKDADQDGLITYTLLQPSTNSPFHVHPQLGHVSLVTTLDRETQDSYTVVLQATDSSLTLPKSSTESLTVSVTDYNDNAPVCDQQPHILIDGAVVMPVDTILKLNCSDLDAVSGAMQFFKTGGDPVGVFSVDINTGALRLERVPTEAVYTLNVKVVDSGTPALSSFFALTVKIKNSLVFGNLPGTVGISEDAAHGDIVFEVNVTGTQLPVFFRVVNGAGTFMAEPSTGKIVLVSDLDRESAVRHEVEITAWTAVGYTATATLTVSVSDANDNTPILIGNFNISVTEDIVVPSILCTYSAQDDDFGENGNVTFSIIQGNSNSTFAMDPGGTLRLVSSLDAETSRFHVLTIRAEDRGVPSLADTRDVVIIVQDTDEHQPTFVFANRHMFVPEDKAVGSKLIQLQGTDRDVTDNVRMDLTSGNDVGTFVINRNSGEIYLATLLDRELVSEYNLTIQATNSKLEIDTMVLTITVTDVNDNAPVFSRSKYIFYVQHNTAKGTEIGQLEVTDTDIGSNAQFGLQIISGNTGSIFTLDGLKLVTDDVINASAASSYFLVIRATDQGSVFTETTVVVKVAPRNTNPKFLSHEDDTTVAENSLTGQGIYDLQATLEGAVEGEEGDVQYIITSGNELGLFYVDKLSGQVYIINVIDFETAKAHSLIFRAENRNDPSLSDVMNLTVYVNSVNDAAPVFSQHEFVMTMNEGLSVGTSIGQVTAQDADQGAFGQVQYQLEPTSKFSIDPISGVVATQEVLWRSDQNFFNLIVYAIDNAGPACLTSSAAILVRVSDVNDHAPRFPDAPYDITVPESVTSGVAVLALAPVDDDEKENGRVTCSITGGNGAGLFSVDPSSCFMKVNGTLDYESQTELNLTVTATDGGSLSKMGVATVLVHVTDVNDHAPNFTPSELHVQVSRTAPVRTEVVTVNATDADSGYNAEVTYVLLSGNDGGYFIVDLFTGRLDTVTDLALAGDTHSLVVTATDAGLPAMTGTVTVTVDITPYLAPPPADVTFAVTENSPVGTQAGIISSDPALSVTSYEIVSGNFNNNFKIVTDANKDGVVLTGAALDRETYAVYHLTVVAYHAGGKETTQVTVNVGDKNDNAPKFLNRNLAFPVMENLAAGATVEKLTVTDADEGSNADVTLTISSSSPVCSLYLRVNTDGSIIVKKAVDYEIVQSFLCKIIATDKGSPALTASTTLTVDVIDVTEQLLQVASPSNSIFLSLEVPYDSTTVRVIHTLTASDFGMVRSPGDTLQFVSVSQDDVFIVGAYSGEVTNGKRELLYDESRYFQWVVCSHTSGAATDHQLGMLRVDAFNMNNHVVAVTVAVGVDYLETHRSSLRSRLKLFFDPSGRVEILETRALTSPGGTRRRLLADGSVALVYVVADATADTAAGVDQPKTFLTQQAILQALQESSDGTPVPGLSDTTLPVDQVMAYNNAQGNEPQAFLDTPEGLAIVLVLIMLFVLVAVFLLTCCLWRVYKRQRRRKLASKSMLASETVSRRAVKNTKQHKLRSETRAGTPDDDTSRLLNQLLPISLLISGRFAETPPDSTAYREEVNQKINTLRDASKQGREQEKNASEQNSRSRHAYDSRGFEHSGDTDQDNEDDSSKFIDDFEDIYVGKEAKLATYIRTTRAEPALSAADNFDVRTPSAGSSESPADTPVTSPHSILKSSSTARPQSRKEKSDVSISFRDDHDSLDGISVEELVLDDDKKETSSQPVKSPDMAHGRRVSSSFVNSVFSKWGKDKMALKRLSMPDALRVSPAFARRRSSPAISDIPRRSLDSHGGISRWLGDSSRFTQIYGHGSGQASRFHSSRNSVTGSNSLSVPVVDRDCTLRMRKVSPGGVDESELPKLTLDNDVGRKLKVDRPNLIPTVRRQSLFV